MARKSVSFDFGEFADDENLRKVTELEKQQSSYRSI